MRVGREDALHKGPPAENKANMRIALLVIHTNSCADALHHCHPATKLGADKEAAVAVRAQPLREPMAAQGQDYYVQVQCSRARVFFPHLTCRRAWPRILV